MPHLVLDCDRLLHIVLPDAAIDGHLASALAEADALGSSGRLTAAARLPEAAQEARWALGAAEAEPGARPIRRPVLLPTERHRGAGACHADPRPAGHHDAGRGTAYVDTLRAVLRHNRSWQLAAAELHIHKQTLGYRIRKIEQLTGRGLTRTEHLAEWWFALRAHDLLTGRSPS